MEFEFKFVKQNTLVLAILKGKLRKDTKGELVLFGIELLKLESKMVILYFKEVSLIEPVVYRDFVLLQAEVRKTKKLYLCGFTQAQKQVLLEKAIIRVQETRGDLLEALEDLSKSSSAGIKA